MWEVPGHRLTTSMDGRREEEGSDSSAPGTPIRQSRVEVRQAGREAPVRLGGELLGFAEAMGEPTLGTIQLTAEALILIPGAGGADDSENGNPPEVWPLLEIRSVQTSSSSLQLSPPRGGLVQLRFASDSPFRWETILRQALRGAYRTAGLGEIVEFQPRIVVE